MAIFSDNEPITIRHHGKPVNDMHPTLPQKAVITTVASLVGLITQTWSPKSGKTVLRKMLAQIILDMDS